MDFIAKGVMRIETFAAQDDRILRIFADNYCRDYLCGDDGQQAHTVRVAGRTVGNPDL